MNKIEEISNQEGEKALDLFFDVADERKKKKEKQEIEEQEIEEQEDVMIDYPTYPNETEEINVYELDIRMFRI